MKQSESHEVLGYFYCDRDHPNHQNATSILSSLVRQLAIGPKKLIQRSIVDIYNEKRRIAFASGGLKLEECQGALTSLVTVYSQATLVVDALDECDNATRSTVIDVLYRLVRESPNPIKVFASSRPKRGIAYRFKDVLALNIKATDNLEDIKMHVKYALSNSSLDWQHEIGSDLRKKICETLVEQSEGM